MAKYISIHNNFNAGMLTERLSQRTDLVAVNNGLRTCQNFVPMEEGGVTSRTGSLYVAGTKDHTKLSVLRKFLYSNTDAYILEVGNQYIRFYKNGGQILESDLTITGITQANPAVVTSASHGLSNGDQVYITEVAGMTEVNNTTQYYVVANKTANTFELTDQDGNNVNSTSFTAYSSGGVINKIYTLTTTYLEADLRELNFTQTADTIFITHENYAPAKLIRTSDTNWTITPLMKDAYSTSATYAFDEGAYLPENTTTTTLDPAATGSPTTITASSITGINDNTGFKSTDVGRIIRYHDGTNYHWYEITAYIDTLNVTVELRDGTPVGHGATTQWSLGAWSVTTGFPTASTLFEGRLCFTGLAGGLITFWASETDSFYQFTPGVGDSNPITATLGGEAQGKPLWMVSQDGITIGTVDGCYSVSSASSSVALSPTSIKSSKISSKGASTSASAIPIDGNIVYPSFSGKRVFQMAYNADVDGVQTTALNLLNKEIMGSGVVQLAHSTEPVEVIWALSSDGFLTGVTYLPSQEIVGWHKHVFGGTGTSVESVATIPTSGQTQVWVSIKRTIDGTTRRYIERLDTEFFEKDVTDGVFLDSAIVNTPVTPDATLTPSATTGASITLTAGSSVFVSTDVGRIVSGNSGTAVILTYSSGTSVTAEVLLDFASTSAIASGDWTMSVSEVSGLDHLEGETVSVLADGGEHIDATVTSGTITLDDEYTKITVGLPYNRVLETFDMTFGETLGNIPGSLSSISKYVVELYETTALSIGYDSTSLTPIIFRDGTDQTGTGTPLFTGEKRVTPKTGTKEKSKIYVFTDSPLPATILGLTAIGNVGQ